MYSKFKKSIYFLWPPLEYFIEQKNIDLDNSKKQNISANEIRNLLTENNINPEESISFSNTIYESENNRKDTIESKAQSLLFAVSIAITIVASIPLLFSENWGIPSPIAIIGMIFYTLSITHLLIAGYYSSLTRKISGFALPNADLFLKMIKSKEFDTINKTALTIEYIKYNEPLLSKKANSLSISEKMFLRGLILIAIASLFVTSGKLITEISKSSITPEESSYEIIIGKLDSLNRSFMETNEILYSNKKCIDSLAITTNALNDEVIYLKKLIDKNSKKIKKIKPNNNLGLWHNKSMHQMQNAGYLNLMSRAKMNVNLYKRSFESNSSHARLTCP